MTPRTWRVLGALALIVCVGAGALAAPRTAEAATNWIVGRGGSKGGTGKAVVWSPPASVSAKCAGTITWNINISWSAVPHATSYTVTRHGSGSGTVGTVSAPTTSITDTQLSLIGIGSYYYTITATVGNWTSAASSNTGTVTLYTILFITYCSG